MSSAASYYNAEGRGRYTDRPTISYVPLAGERFINGVIQEIMAELSVGVEVPSEDLTERRVARMTTMPRQRSFPDGPHGRRETGIGAETTR